MDSQSEKVLLKQILHKLEVLDATMQQIRQRVEQLETTQNSGFVHLSPKDIQEIDLINLPDPLRRTMLAISKLKEATPDEVANETHRTRGLENIYLNQLEMLGYLEKLKRGRRVYYRSLRII